MIPFPIRLSVFFALCLSFLIGPAEAVIITAPPSSSDGYYEISWESEAGDGGSIAFILEEATRPDFSDARVLYEGADKKTAMSGKLNGEYFYRVRKANTEWSAPSKVTVLHHDLAKAMIFLGIGAVVFIATASLIIAGHLRHRKEMAEEPWRA